MTEIARANIAYIEGINQAHMLTQTHKYVNVGSQIIILNYDNDYVQMES
jgi:hypothetical protein